MPRQQPELSFQQLRNYTEKFSWEDQTTGLRTTGYNPPADAKLIERVPFFIRFVTQSGILEEGNVVCLKVDLKRHQRMIQFVNSGEIRIACDYLIIEVDGVRFFTH